MAELSPQLHRDIRISSEIEGRNPQYTLTIKAKAEYNGTTVQCLINGGFSDQSDNVSLIIQGKKFPTCALSRVILFKQKSFIYPGMHLNLIT